MIKILIADDHAIVREGLKQIVSEETDMKVMGEAENAEELFEHIKREEWDIIVLDINMPGKTDSRRSSSLKLIIPGYRCLY